MKVDRVVCDTDVLISAAIVEQGKPRRVLDYVLDHGTLVLSAALYAEVATRLLRPKFWKYLSEESRDYYLKRLELLGNFVAIPGTLTGAVRDPDDDKFLETAIVGEAECLVTGDGDLPALRPVGEHAEAETPTDACSGAWPLCARLSFWP